VAHVVGFSEFVLRDKAGVAPASSPSVADDPAAAFRAIREAVHGVLDDPTTPADVTGYLDLAVSFDLAQHWWDLAKATGQDATMDPEEVELLWAALSPMTPGWWKWQVDNGHYAPAVHVADDAPLQDRVLGLTGRNPKWTPPT
jgi:hypothetical protein